MEKQINVTVTPQFTNPITEDSPTQAVIQSIVDKLGAINELKYIDADWGQLDGYSPNFPVKFPCALVDITQAQYSNLGRDPQLLPANRQQADIAVTITVANLRLTPSNPKNNKLPPPANDIHLIIQVIHEQLHGYPPTPKAAPLIRQSLQRTRRDDGVQQYTITYISALNNV
jgi:hypothetical protein